MKTLSIRRYNGTLAVGGTWNGPVWRDIQWVAVDNFRPESSDHRPRTQVKALHDGRSVHIHYKVEDRYVRATRLQYMDDVWNDSCVEFFAQPKTALGYINFETNCCGTLLATYVEDPARLPGGKLTKATPLPREIASLVEIRHSLTGPIDPEISTPVEWTLEAKIPIAVFEPFTGPIGDLSGQRWRANFHKCADETSHPAWATWNPISALNFHLPADFGEIVFE